MPARIERPDQEAESGRAGDWTGRRYASRRALHLSSLNQLFVERERLPAAGGNYRHKADQCRSETGRIESCFPCFMVPAPDDAVNDVVDQQGSEMRRTESSACGDGPCNPKTTCSGTSEEKAPEQEADKKTAQSQKGEDNVQRSTLTLRKDLKVVKAGKPVPAAGEGDDDVQRSTLTLRDDLKVVKAGKPVPAAGEGDDDVQRSTLTLRKDLKVVKAGKPVPAAGEGDDDEHAQGTETCTEPSPAAANREGNHELRGKPGTRGSERRKSAPENARNRTWSAAVERHKLVFTVLMFSLIWTAVMGSEEVEQAAMSCSLNDTYNTSIIIKWFRTGSDPETVMFCDKNNSNCSYYYKCALVKRTSQAVLFKCPETMLEKNATLKLQPPNENQPFIPCDICFSCNTGAGQSPNTALIWVGVGLLIILKPVIV